MRGTPDAAEDIYKELDVDDLIEKAYNEREIVKLTFDWGRHDGWRLLGYYTNKDKAERTAKEAYENRNHIDTGKTRITEIEINTED